MAHKITDRTEIFSQDADDLLLIYDVLQEKTSTIRAKTFRGGITHTSVNSAALAPVTDLEDSTFDGLLIKVGDFWRDDTTAVDGSYREYQATAVDYDNATVTWSSPILYTPRKLTTFDLGDQSNTFLPIPHIAAAMWGGVIPISGDYVEYDITGSTMGKRVKYGPAIVAPTGVIDWGERRSAYPRGIYSHPTKDHPPRNDLNYFEGDFMGGKEGNTYGPYVERKTSDLESWPLLSKRAIHVYSVNRATDVEALAVDVNSLSDPVPFEGDRIRIFVNGGEKEYLGDIERVDPTDDMYLPASGFKITDLHNPKGVRVYHTGAGVLRPSIDDEHYSQGDIAITEAANQFGPYVTGQTDVRLAWPVMIIRPTISTTVSVIDNAAANAYDPNTISPRPVHGDVLLVSTTDGTGANNDRTKIRRFLITKKDANDEDFDPVLGFELTVKQNYFPIRSFHEFTDTRPVRDDRVYSDNDMINTSAGSHIDTDGVLFGPYTEGQSSDAAAWPVHTLRQERTFEVDVATNADAVAYDLSLLPQPILAGDHVLFTLATDMMIRFTLTRVDPLDGPFQPTSGLVLAHRTNGTTARWHATSETNVPARDDETYAPGDMIVNGNAKMYGPYVGEQATDALAWPTGPDIAAAASVGNPSVLADDTVTRSEFRVDENNNPYLVEL